MNVLLHQILRNAFLVYHLKQKRKEKENRKEMTTCRFTFFLTRWEISLTQFDEEAPSVDFLLAT